VRDDIPNFDAIKTSLRTAEEPQFATTCLLVAFQEESKGCWNIHRFSGVMIAPDVVLTCAHAGIFHTPELPIYATLKKTVDFSIKGPRLEEQLAERTKGRLPTLAPVSKIFLHPSCEFINPEQEAKGVKNLNQEDPEIAIQTFIDVINQRVKTLSQGPIHYDFSTLITFPLKGMLRKLKGTDLAILWLSQSLLPSATIFPSLSELKGFNEGQHTYTAGYGDMRVCSGKPISVMPGIYKRHVVTSKPVYIEQHGLLVSTFQQPSGQATGGFIPSTPFSPEMAEVDKLEGCVEGGDSGGGMYFSGPTKGVWHLAAITSRTAALNLDAMHKAWDMEKLRATAPEPLQAKLDQFLSEVQKKPIFFHNIATAITPDIADWIESYQKPNFQVILAIKTAHHAFKHTHILQLVREYLYVNLALSLC